MSPVSPRLQKPMSSSQRAENSPEPENAIGPRAGVDVVRWMFEADLLATARSIGARVNEKHVLIVGSLILFVAAFMFVTNAVRPEATLQGVRDPAPMVVAPIHDRIDEFVDAQAERVWRPMPGGNSKEDAKKLTKEVLRAKTFDELEEVIRRNAAEGR